MDQLERAEIDDILCQVLRTIYHYERSIAMNYGLDFQQIYALQYLRRHPDARLTDIAAEMELPKIAVSRLISHLIDAGILSKSQDLVDRRNYPIQLEASGEQVLQVIETASFQHITANLEGFPQMAVTKLVGQAKQMHIVLGVTDKVIQQP